MMSDLVTYGARYRDLLLEAGEELPLEELDELLAFMSGLLAQLVAQRIEDRWMEN